MFAATGVLPFLSLAAALLYLAEFAVRLSLAGWRRRPPPRRFRKWKRTGVIVAAVVPIAAFFVWRPVAIGIAGLLFVAVVANELTDWRRERTLAQNKPTAHPAPSSPDPSRSISAVDLTDARTSGMIVTPRRKIGDEVTRHRIDPRAEMIVDDDYVELHVRVGNDVSRATCEVTDATRATYRTTVAATPAAGYGVSLRATMGPRVAVARYPTDFSRAPDDLGLGYYEAIWRVPDPHGLKDQLVKIPWIVVANKPFEAGRCVPLIADGTRQT